MRYAVGAEVECLVMFVLAVGNILCQWPLLKASQLIPESSFEHSTEPHTVRLSNFSSPLFTDVLFSPVL